MKALFLLAAVLLATVGRAEVGILAALSARGISFELPKLASANNRPLLHRYEGTSTVVVTTVISSSIGYSFSMSLWPLT